MGKVMMLSPRVTPGGVSCDIGCLGPEVATLVLPLGGGVAMTTQSATFSDLAALC